MGWRFCKTVTTGPIRHTITHKGIGSSIGFLGARIGITPSGDFYFSFRISKTGLYYIRYLRRSKISDSRGTRSLNRTPGKIRSRDKNREDKINKK
jgi:hypothetical protein